MNNWDGVRGKFPATEKFVYLNSASESPTFIEAAETGKEYYDKVLQGDCDWDAWCKKVEEVRVKIANLINADKSEIAFIPNTSFGINCVAQMLKGKVEVLTMEDEFPASTLPWINQGFKLNFVKPDKGIYSIEDIDQYVNNKTRILVTSHVQAFTGFKQDLVELGKYCKSKNLIYVVNATQSIGVTQIDVKKANIDFLVFSSVKWLNTAEGIGAIYINKKWFKKAKWPMVGWLSVKDIYKFDNKYLNLKEDASVLELGALCLHSIFVMGKAIDLVNSIGIQNIEERLGELTSYLITKLKELNLEILSPISEKYQSPIIIIKLKNSREIVKQLSKKGIIVSERIGKVRISVNIFNNKEDIDKFIFELEKILL